MEGVTYLYIGLTIVWLGIFAYIVYLHKLQTELKGRLESIELRVKTEGKIREHRIEGEKR